MSIANKNKEGIPWVEKYRPTAFQDIVLSELNRKLFENVLSSKYVPNLLFYGPPGTGKTTTIINLINAYQEETGQTNKSSVIHLNASDERGIDIIRNQIYQFVRSKNFFETGLKFVILDEVDYMTKNAQQALKFLLQTSSYNVRFCLICNYISKIDESLKNEFLCIRFNQLPKSLIFTFLKNIAENESIKINDGMIETIQEHFHSDIRSMINFLQLHQNTTEWISNIITSDIYDTLHQRFGSGKKPEIMQYIHDLSIQYNTDKKTIITNYFNYMIRNKTTHITPEYLNKVATILHNREFNIEHIVYLMMS